MHVIGDQPWKGDRCHVHSPPLDLSEPAGMDSCGDSKYFGSGRLPDRHLALIPKPDPPIWDSRIGTPYILYSHTHGVCLVYESLVSLAPHLYPEPPGH